VCSNTSLGDRPGTPRRLGSTLAIRTRADEDYLQLTLAGWDRAQGTGPCPAQSVRQELLVGDAAPCHAHVRPRRGLEHLGLECQSARSERRLPVVLGDPELLHLSVRIPTSWRTVARSLSFWSCWPLTSAHDPLTGLKRACSVTPRSDLSDHDLTGTIPSAIGSLTKLTKLYVPHSLSDEHTHRTTTL
jgi:hypothetical protein